MYLTADEEQQPLRPGTTLAFADSTDTKPGRRGEDIDDEDMLLTGAPPPSSRGGERAEGGDEEEKLEKDLLMKLQMLGPSIIGCYTEAGGEKISLSWKDMQAVKVRLLFFSHRTNVREVSSPFLVLRLLIAITIPFGYQSRQRTF